MGFYWAVFPVALLAVGFLGVLAYERLLGRRAPAVVSLLPTILALAIVTWLYYFTRHQPLEATLFVWDNTGSSPIALAYYVDAWGSMLAGLALLLGTCAQALIAAGRVSGGNGSDGNGSSESERARSNWSQIGVLGGLALLLNLVFAANLVILFMSWCALGLLVYASLQAIGQLERRDTAATSGGQDPGDDVEERRSGERMSTLKYLAAYGLLGSVLLLASPGDNLSLSLGAHEVELGLLPSAFLALAVAAYLGLYPFGLWGSRVGTALSVAAAPLSILPMVAAFYVLGRLYPMAIERTSGTVSTIIGLLAVATILVSAARVWTARSPGALLSHAIAIEASFAVVALALTDLRTFPAAILIFLNCALAAQAVALSSAVGWNVSPPRHGRGSDDGSPDGGLPTRRSALPRLDDMLLVAPWLSLTGLPFTLAFTAKWMLFAASSDLRLVALWPIAAVANGLVLVATLRLLDQKLFGADLASLAARDQASDATGSARGDVVSAVSSDATSDATSAVTSDVTGDGEAIANGQEGAQRSGKRGARTVLLVASLLPWAMSLAIGLLPNQALRWIVVPAAGAILGEDYAQLFVARMAVSDGLFSGITLASMLLVVALAVYAYPMPLARRALIALSGRVVSPAASPKPETVTRTETATVTEAAAGSLRSVFLEAIIGSIAVLLTRWSAPDGAIEMMSRWLERMGDGLASLNDTVHESYFYPALAVCGFIVLLLFLG